MHFEGVLMQHSSHAWSVCTASISVLSAYTTNCTCCVRELQYCLAFAASARQHAQQAVLYGHEVRHAHLTDHAASVCYIDCATGR
jgi:hypothetical protein